MKPAIEPSILPAAQVEKPLAPPSMGRRDAVRLCLGDPRSRLTSETVALIDRLWHDLGERLVDALIMRLPLEHVELAEADRGPILHRLRHQSEGGPSALADLILERIDMLRSRPQGVWLEQQLASGDADLSSAALALLVARSSRRDGQGYLAIDLDDLTDELLRALGTRAALAIRPSLAALADRDSRLGRALDGLMAAHEPSRSLGQYLDGFAAALYRSAEIAPDEAMVALALDGESYLLAGLMARICGRKDAFHALTQQGGEGAAGLIAMTRCDDECTRTIVEALAPSLEWGAVEAVCARVTKLRSLLSTGAALPDDYRRAIEGNGDGE